MQSKPKSNSLITSTIPEGTDMVHVTVTIPVVMLFTVLDEGNITLNLQKVHPVNLGRALVYGFNQRLPDGAAIGLTDKEGDIIPAEERTRMKWEKMVALRDHYESGTAEWSRRGDGNGEGARSITLEAIARVQECTYEEAAAMVQARAEKTGKKTAAILAKLRGADSVAKAILAIRMERDEKRPMAVDADEELNALKAE